MILNNVSSNGSSLVSFPQEIHKQNMVSHPIAHSPYNFHNMIEGSLLPLQLASQLEGHLQLRCLQVVLGSTFCRFLLV